MDSATADLIDRARDGDRNAFDALVGPLIDPAFRLAFGLLHDRGAAEDAVQEASFKAWRKLSNLRPGTPLRPWFFAIVANQSRTTLRGRWWGVVKMDAIDRAAPPGTPGMEDGIVRGADLRRAIRRLNHDQRLAIVLHFYLDLPLEEVAAITGVPLGTVKSRLHRAVGQLRPQLEAREVFT
jgi:RNA polymerase sigma factor (sigma-70 family)